MKGNLNPEKYLDRQGAAELNGIGLITTLFTGFTAVSAGLYHHNLVLTAVGASVLGLQFQIYALEAQHNLQEEENQ